MAMVTYQSGLPYSALSSYDNNGDGVNTDYALGYGGRNAQRQPGSKTSSLRFTRNWQLAGKLEVEVNMDIFNVLNWANYSTSQYTAVDSKGAALSSFGGLNVLDQSSREVQFGVRVKF